MILLPYILAVYSGAHVNHTPCPARISSRQEIAEAPPASWLAHKADMNHLFGDLGLYFGHPERLALVAPIKREIDGGFELDWDLRGYGKEIWLNCGYSGTALSYTKFIGRPMGCVYRRYRKNGLVHAEFECNGDEPTARQGSLDLPSPMDGASMSRHYKKYSNATVESCPGAFVEFVDYWWAFHTPNTMNLKDEVDPEKYIAELEELLAKSRIGVRQYCDSELLRQDMKRLKAEFPDGNYRKPLEAFVFGDRAIYDKQVPDY
jgi:hypothetical protein